MDRDAAQVTGLPFDLYVWQGPAELDAVAARTALASWHEAGGDPAASPFPASTDVGWFARELRQESPSLEIVTDARPNPSTKPVWLSTTDEPPARLVAIRLGPETARDDLEAIVGLAAKYDLLLYDARRDAIHRPLEAMAAHASATFWPRGAIQAAVAGGVGFLIAVVAWILTIPILSGLLVVVGGFLFVMAVLTFVHEGRVRLRQRRSGSSSTPSG